MNKKETLEFVLNGLKEQFTELGSLMKITEGETSEIAQAKISTGNSMIIIATLLDNLKESKKTEG
ncbi:hypothetical protein [Clostridium baratii]|uniref:hypothetical protein n=1 Tax=Clostridium baratii TaxID=1561 RepID=UPI0030D23AA0